MITEVLDLGLNLLNGFLKEEKKPTRVEDVLPQRDPCDWMFDDKPAKTKQEKKVQKKEDSSIHVDVRDSHNVWININIQN